MPALNIARDRPCAQGMEFEVKPVFKGKMSALPMPIATTLHHSFTGGFCNAGILAWAGPRDKKLLATTVT